MSNNNQNGHTKVNPIAAAVAGAVVTAGIAGAVALKDKKTRDKVKKVLATAKNQAIGYMKKLPKATEEKKSDLKKNLPEVKKEVKKAIDSAKDASNHVVKAKKIAAK